LGHEHPKVRRAVASALGNFRDEQTASALITAATGDASYFVRAAALTALGRTRDPRAFDILAAAVRERHWNGVVESGAARGLGELADPRATDVIVGATAPENDVGLRVAGVAALARAGELLDSQRTRVVEALDRLLDDPAYPVAATAIAGIESLGDARHLPSLERIAQVADEDRLRRAATDAAIRIREAQKVPAQVTALRTDIDTLREEQRKIQEKLESLAGT
jgi:aminopeptidase N